MKRSAISRAPDSSDSETDVKSPTKTKNAENSENESPEKKIDKKEATAMKEVKENAKTESPKKKKPKNEKSKDPAAGSFEPQTDNEGKLFYDIGRNRRVSLNTFKGKQMINIREFYLDKASQSMKPGKSGISLYEDEWKKLTTLANEFKFD